VSISCLSARPALPRGAEYRVVAGLLGFALTFTTLALAAPAAAASAPPPAGVSSVQVDELTYASGAGRRSWGLRRHAAWSARVVKHGFPAITVGGYRSSSGDHGERLAADFMVYQKATKGDRIASFAKRHHRQLNVTYVIWYQRIWSVDRPRAGWRRMEDRGSLTANHRDHVHVSFRREPTDYTHRR